jgi:hypothetical protein
MAIAVGAAVLCLSSSVGAAFAMNKKKEEEEILTVTRRSRPLLVNPYEHGTYVFILKRGKVICPCAPICSRVIQIPIIYRL